MLSSVSNHIPQQEIYEPRPRMVSNYSSPPRKGRAAKTRANRSLSEEGSEEDSDSVEMIDIEEEFSETLLLDPASPPRKLSMRSKVILKRVDVARAREIHTQVKFDHHPCFHQEK